MKMLIRDFAKLTGVSIRTLHYYDEIGLLKPSIVDEQNGYRFYDEENLERMQEILFYRELDFPLKSIAPPIIPCQKDESRKEIYQGRKMQECYRISSFSDEEKFSLCRVFDGKV